MKASLYLLLLVVAVALAGCGTKGPLVLPPSNVPADQPRTPDEPLDDDEWVEEPLWDDGGPQGR